MTALEITRRIHFAVDSARAELDVANQLCREGYSDRAMSNIALAQGRLDFVVRELEAVEETA